MTVPILTAVTGAAWESRLVGELEAERAGLSVVRRCVDVADLLAAVAAGHGRAVLLSADLRRLDRDVLDRMTSAGVAVIGVVPAGDEDGERRLRQLGVQNVVTADATADVVVEQVRAALAALVPTGRAQSADSPGSLDPPDSPEMAAPNGAPENSSLGAAAGRVVAVWGPTGAPGRTTLAVNLAAEAAWYGRATLLADADTYGGAVGQMLGLLDEAPGLAGAVRSANHGQLDLPALARHARQVMPRLRVLTGITRTDRWPEIRPPSLEVVWQLCRGLAELTVVDLGFCLEADEELSFDTAAPRRNGATLTTLAHADTIIAVGSADPVGMQRLIRGLADLTEAVPGASVLVVVNRLRASVVGPRPADQIREALWRYTTVPMVPTVPTVRQVVTIADDQAAADAAVLAGQTLGEVAPDSPARAAIAQLAAELTNVPERYRARDGRHRTRGWSQRRRGKAPTA